MKYNIRASAAAFADEGIATVHDRIFQHLQTRSKLCQGRAIPAAPKIKGGNITAYCNLGGFLPRGMEGHIVYLFRPETGDGPLRGADSLDIKFTPDANFGKDILEDFLPALIGGMNPYLVTVGDQRFEDPVISSEGIIKVGGPRASGCELYPVFFMDEWPLQIKYKLSPEAAMTALQPVVHKISMLNNGIYVTGSAEPLDYEAAKSLVHRIEERLHQARPGLINRLKRLLQRNA